MAENAAPESNSAEVPATNPPAPNEGLGLSRGASAEEAAKALSQRRKRVGSATGPVKPVDGRGQTEENNRLDSASDEAGADSQGEGQEALEAQAESEGEAQAGAEADSGDFPTTFSGLAEALGAEYDDLAHGLTLTGRVNGEEIEISVAEALDGYQRQRDYTKRTQELSDAQRAFEAERDQILERAKQQTETAENWLGVLANAIQAGPNDADLAALAQTDPDRYVAEKARRDNLMAAYNHVALQRKEMIDKAAKDAEANRAKVFEEQRQALIRLSRDKSSGVTDPNDHENWPVFEGKIRTYLGKKGFSEKDVGEFLAPGGWSAPQMAIIADAMYGQSVRQKGAGAGEKVRHLPKVLKPGAPKDRTQSNAEKVNAARKRLAQGRAGRRGDDDAVALLRAKRAARKGR